MKTLSIALLAAAAFLSSCDSGKAEAPSGQVVATFDGKEVTLAELKAEVGDLSGATDANTRAQIERAALQQVLARKILAGYATDNDLDKTPLAAILRQRGEETGLAELVQRKLQSEVPATSREEAQIYVNDNPSSFAQRRIFVVDQYVARGAPAAVVKQMEPLDTMEEIAALLTRNKVPFTKTVGTIDSLAINPASAQQITALPSGAVFVSPEGAVTRVNRIKEVQVEPVQGEDAIRIAQEIIRSRRAQEIMQGQMGSILKAGMAKVNYNASYAPPAAPKGAPESGNQQAPAAPKS